MNAFFFVTLAGVFTLAVTLVWALRRPKAVSCSLEPASLQAVASRRGRDHATYLTTICQAMSSEDFQFLEARAAARALRRAHRERQRIAFLYLAELRGEFYSLLRLARVIAALSPQIRAAQELERVGLALRFLWRYHLVLLGLYFGLLFLPQLCGLSAFISQLAVRMDEAIRGVAEQTALADDLGSSLDRRRLDLI
jgi:hypothetical protein